MRMFAESDLDPIFKAFHERRFIWLVVVGVFAVAWFVCREMLSGPIADHIFLRHIKRRLLKKQFIEDLVSETFEGKVELVTDKLLGKKASKERILQFYSGAKLHWDVIAANGDIPRDQHSELKKLAEIPSGETKLLCVTAEAGAGKSTIAWRVVADFSSQGKDFLIVRVVANEDAEVWQRLSDFQRILNRPLLVLVDDIFRDQDTANAFIDLPPSLPLTILATSRRNEFRSRAKRLKCQCTEIRLNPPSADEKERVLKNIGKVRADLTADQRRRLDDANQFIVLMIELIGGKELHEVIRDTINRLYQLEINHSAYSAYKYLCFAGQFGISLPVSLLGKINPEFNRLIDREIVDGMIFPDDRSGFVRAGHPVIAKTATDIYAADSGCAPKQILVEIVAALDHTNLTERRFVAHLVRAIATAQLIKPDLLFLLVKDLVLKCVQSADRISELTIWRAFCLKCGQHKLAEHCVDLAIARDPQSGIECNLLHYLFALRNREKDALLPISKWIANHPEHGLGRISYLALVEKYATNDIPKVVIKLNQWLDANPDEIDVRSAFLVFVERNENNSIGQYIKKYEKWLENHSDDHHVRAAYLGVVGRNGTDEQIRDVILSAHKWLQKPENKDDIGTRVAFLGLLKRRWALHHGVDSGSDEWLKKRGLVGEALPYEQILKKNIDWLKEHPAAKEVWVALLGLLFFLKRNDEAITLVSEAISLHPDDQNIMIHYLHALYESDIPPQKTKEVFERLIKQNPMQRGAKLLHAAWLRDKCQREEAEAYYNKLIDEYPNAYEPYCGLGQHYLNLQRFDEGAEQFTKVLKMRLGYRHQLAHAGLGQALWKLGKDQEAERELELAIEWAGKKEQSAAMFQTLLGRFYLDYKKWGDAIKAFEAANEEDPEYFGNYWGIGQALCRLGKFAEAADALLRAIELKPDLEPPASDEIKALLDQCDQRSSSTKQT